jgi:RNA 2',3'-cyclic 3'-phosphodiesterase
LEALNSVPRLFSAVELPELAAMDLRTQLASVQPDVDALSWVPPDSWHITLGFYGNREHPDRRGPWLRRRLDGLASPRVRLRCSGGFPGVLWIGVEPANPSAEQALNAVAAAARPEDQTDELEFRPHVTVARWRRGPYRNPLAEQASRALASYTGPWWTATEVVLFRSQLRPDGPVYSALERVQLKPS